MRQAGRGFKLSCPALGLPLPVEQPASEPEDGTSDEDEGEESETANYSFEEDSDDESGAFGDDDGESTSYATTAISRCTSVSSARIPSFGSVPLRTRQLSIHSLPGREDIEIVRYRSPKEFVDALAPYEQWQMAPVLAPAAALLHAPRQDHRRNSWLCAYSKSRDRLECARRHRERSDAA